jgi:hypothetical protein
MTGGEAIPVASGASAAMIEAPLTEPGNRVWLYARALVRD